MPRSERNTPPGADRRYGYVPFAGLRPADQMKASQVYPHGTPWLPVEEYLYPVRKDGSLADARRHMPADRAKELHDLHVVQEILES